MDREDSALKKTLAAMERSGSITVEAAVVVPLALMMIFPFALSGLFMSMTNPIIHCALWKRL